VILIRLLICVSCFSTALYFYLDKHNQIMKIRYVIPTTEDAINTVMEQNAALTYEIEKFESPLNLMQLLQQPEYSHLRHPELADILWISASKQGPSSRADPKR
jgi:hypothetical protein